MKDAILKLEQSEAYKDLCELLDDNEAYVSPKVKSQVAAMNGAIELNLQ